MAQEQAAVANPADGSDGERLAFARSCFDNVQNLSRMMDQKAGYILSAVSLLTMTLGIVAARALGPVTGGALDSFLHSAGLVFFAIYVSLAFAVVFTATSVFRAMPYHAPPDSDVPGLIFPLMLLSRVSSGARPNDHLYFTRLSTLSTREILHDYANQIVEVSTIYRHKQRRVNLSTTLFQWLEGCWLLTVLVLVAMLVVT